MASHDGSYTRVTLWIGEARWPRCVADVFDGDDLTITSLDSGAVVTVYPAGDWVNSVSYDGHGLPLYAHTAKTPTRQPLPIAELFPTLRKGAA